MRAILRFRDLRDRKIVNSWPQLKRRIEVDGFPVGFYMGANSRAWFEDEIQAWIEARPSAATEAKPPLKGAARTKAAARVARELAGTSSA